MSTCLPLLLEYVEALGHAVFTNGTYNLNIIGIRTPDDDANKFNDRLCVVYKDELGWVTRTWPITTDPGTYWRENPMRVTGTAILVPGQYRGAYKIGKHRGKYDALVQRGGRVRLYRDANKDDILDMEPENIADPTYAGINIHKAGEASTEVNKWSAGCQVFANENDFDEFMDLVWKSEEMYGETFTYTLVDAPLM
jgi:hypothetical protein